MLYKVKELPIIIQKERVVMFVFYVTFSEKNYLALTKEVEEDLHYPFHANVTVFIHSDSYYRHDNRPGIYGDDASVLLFEHWVNTNQTTTISGFPIELFSMSACELETALQAGQAKKEIFYVREGEIDKDDKPGKIPPGLII